MTRQGAASRLPALPPKRPRTPHVEATPALITALPPTCPVCTHPLPLNIFPANKFEACAPSEEQLDAGLERKRSTGNLASSGRRAHQWDVTPVGQEPPQVAISVLLRIATRSKRRKPSRRLLTMLGACLNQLRSCISLDVRCRQGLAIKHTQTINMCQLVDCHTCKTNVGNSWADPFDVLANQGVGKKCSSNVTLVPCTASTCEGPQAYRRAPPHLTKLGHWPKLSVPSTCALQPSTCWDVAAEHARELLHLTLVGHACFPTCGAQNASTISCTCGPRRLTCPRTSAASALLAATTWRTLRSAQITALPIGTPPLLSPTS